MSLCPLLHALSAPIFQPQKKDRLLLAPAVPHLELGNSASPGSHEERTFGGRRDGNDAEVRSTHWLFAACQAENATEKGSLRSNGDGALIYRCPSAGCFRRAPILRYFPTITRSLASVHCPRPAALGVLLRPIGRPPGLGFQRKDLPTASAPDSTPAREERAPGTPAEGARFFLRSLRRKTRLRHLGAGHLASLRARVSRVTLGQIQTGEMTWHSTKTRSR
jgi:hypothetical protein